MVTKTSTADTREEPNYRLLINEGLRELRQLQEESVRQNAEIKRLRETWLRKQKAIDEALRRVEATL
jgi:hypothetical protein